MSSRSESENKQKNSDQSAAVIITISERKDLRANMKARLGRIEMRDRELAALQVMSQFTQYIWPQLMAAGRTKHFQYASATLSDAGELSSSPIIEFLRVERWRIAYPRIESVEEGRMCMREVVMSEAPDSETESVWELGDFGVSSPRESAPLVAPEELALCFVPLLAFDSEGHRIGRGKGFFDRYLAQAPQAIRIGLAYDFQSLKGQLETQEWDIPLHLVITPTKVHEFKSWRPVK